MKNWTNPAIASLAAVALAAVTTISLSAGAQTGEKTAKPMAKEKAYTGCIEAGSAAGTYHLTHAMMADASMGKDATKKDPAAKEPMAKDMGAKMMIMSKSVELSKHVGHKVTVMGTDADMGKGSMAKGDSTAKAETMDKSTPHFTVTSVKMISSTCTM